VFGSHAMADLLVVLPCPGSFSVYPNKLKFVLFPTVFYFLSGSTIKTKMFLLQGKLVSCAASSHIHGKAQRGHPERPSREVENFLTFGFFFFTCSRRLVAAISEEAPRRHASFTLDTNL